MPVFTYFNATDGEVRYDLSAKAQPETAETFILAEVFHGCICRLIIFNDLISL